MRLVLYSTTRNEFSLKLPQIFSNFCYAVILTSRTKR